MDLISTSADYALYKDGDDYVILGAPASSDRYEVARYADRTEAESHYQHCILEAAQERHRADRRERG